MKSIDRVELVVRDRHPGMSRRDAIALCEAGGVRDTAGRPIKKGSRIPTDAALAIDLTALDDRSQVERASLAAKEHDLVWLGQDATWAVIRKPAGLGSLGRHFGDTLHFAEYARRLIKARTKIDTEALPDFGLVHRLDNGTSGCCVFAFDAPTLSRLVTLRDEGALFRTYWAMARNVPQDSGTITSPIEGQDATTTYTVKQRFDGIALFEAKIKGGRRHQIRKHMASLGAPLLGDGKYGEAPANRLALHAKCVNVAGKTFEADPGDHFWAFCPQLRSTQSTPK